MQESASSVPDRSLRGTEPVTDYDSKGVMIRGERGDTIEIEGVVSTLAQTPIPTAIEIQQRTNTYYGPELVGIVDGTTYRVTAPGPDTFLLLWKKITDDDRFENRWARIAEIKATLTTDDRGYTMCQQCGNPIKTVEHERLALIDECPVTDNTEPAAID